jgi:hypothetical protein
MASGDVAVSPQGDGQEVGSLDRRLKVGDGGPRLANGHLAGLNEGNVGGGASDVEDESVVHAGEEAPADGAGSRPGVDGFHGRARGKLVAHQGAIAPDDHEWCVDLAALHSPPHGDDKVLEDGQE